MIRFERVRGTVTAVGGGFAGSALLQTDLPWQAYVALVVVTGIGVTPRLVSRFLAHRLAVKTLEKVREGTLVEASPIIQSALTVMRSEPQEKQPQAGGETAGTTAGEVTGRPSDGAGDGGVVAAATPTASSASTGAQETGDRGGAAS